MGTFTGNFSVHVESCPLFLTFQYGVGRFSRNSAEGDGSLDLGAG
jgi:hypothetical protein